MCCLSDFKCIIVHALKKLYDKDHLLFERNNGIGLSERCIVFRFAHYLQQELDQSNMFSGYIVDCDFNSSSVNGQEQPGKEIPQEDGTNKKRFIDIIVHQRTTDENKDLICFEIKKWNNTSSKAVKKDIQNLQVLTSEYGYRFGFHLILGKVIDDIKIKIFQRDDTEISNNWTDFQSL